MRADRPLGQNTSAIGMGLGKITTGTCRPTLLVSGANHFPERDIPHIPDVFPCRLNSLLAQLPR